VSGKRSRDRGARGELRVRDLYRSHGFQCRRNFQSGAQGMGDLVGGDLPAVIEVKNAERILFWPWVEQAQDGIRPPFAEDEWVLHIKSNGKPPVAVVDELFLMRLFVDQRSLQRAIRTEDA